MTVDPQERSTWRSGVKSAMCAASQLPGRGPTDVDDAPGLYLHLNQKSDYDDIISMGSMCSYKTMDGSLSSGT